MKNYKTLYEKGDEDFWQDYLVRVPKEKKDRKIHKERHRRIKLSFDRHSHEFLFR